MRGQIGSREEANAVSKVGGRRQCWKNWSAGRAVLRHAAPLTRVSAKCSPDQSTPGPRHVFAGRRTEHPSILPAKLRGAFVTDLERDAGGVPGLRQEPTAGFLQPKAFLELERAHVRYRAKMPME